jgi:DNA gyrase/topoisomerase IV subunit A
VISHLPPDVASRNVFDAIEDQESEQTKVAIHDVNDISTMADGTRIIVTLRRNVDREAAIAALHDLWGVHTTMTVRLGDRLPDILRRWVQHHGANDLETRLAQVNQALTD